MLFMTPIRVRVPSSCRTIFHGVSIKTVLVQTGSIADDGRMQPFGPVESLFKGRHFDGQIIVLCVSWYTSFKLSLRDL